MATPEQAGTRTALTRLRVEIAADRHAIGARLTEALDVLHAWTGAPPARPHLVVAAVALHIAVAVAHGLGDLLTWNCKHLANAMLRHRIEAACHAQGYQPAIICTPEELVED